ncbi:signal peptidase I [Micromonospora sp. NPDC052213]|uniref:signal peptidase I n=1 Tax=Micromonospora sp. NPDC052213 TaxID=3155812 RepID=UPI003433BEA9
MDGTVYVGKAGVDGATNAGWLLGHFMPPGAVRHSTDVEVKWGVHPAGEARSRWATGERRTALLVLVSGRFRVELPDRTVVLREPGDYVVWGRGVDHSWYAECEAVVLTVRWPSVPGYRVEPPVRR